RLARLAGKKAPTDPKVLCAEAEVLSLTGALKEAQSLIESLQPDQSKNPEFWNAKAVWLARSGDTNGCVEASRRAVELADWSSEAGFMARERFIRTASEELES